MLGQITKFLASGLAATLLHWGVMALLLKAGIAAIPATAIGALGGMLLNYFAQHRFTFVSQRPHKTVFPRYLLTAACSWALNLLIFWASHSSGIATAPSQMLATATTTVTNFLTARGFVFHDCTTPTRNATTDPYHSHT